MSYLSIKNQCQDVGIYVTILGQTSKSSPVVSLSTISKAFDYNTTMSVSLPVGSEYVLIFINTEIGEVSFLQPLLLPSLNNFSVNISCSSVIQTAVTLSTTKTVTSNIYKSNFTNVYVPTNNVCSSNQTTMGTCSLDPLYGILLPCFCVNKSDLPINSLVPLYAPNFPSNGTGGNNGSNGNDGTNGNDGSNGNDGTNGTDRTDVNDGTNGADGTNGNDGNDGNDVTNGNDGNDGNDGTDGTDGNDGTDGSYGSNNGISTGWWIVISIFSVLIFLLIILFVVYIIYKKGKSKKNKDEVV